MLRLHHLNPVSFLDRLALGFAHALAPDGCFILDYPEQKVALRGIEHGPSDALGHVPRRILINLQILGELPGGDRPPGVEQQGNSKESFLQGQAGTVKESPDRDAKGRVATVASVSPFSR